MDRNKKILVVSAGLVVVGAYFIWKQYNQKPKVANNVLPKVAKKRKPKQVAQNNTSSNNTQDAEDNWDKLLGKGLVANEVGILQEALGGGLKVDNDFGDLTEKRLKQVMGVTQTTLNKYNEFMFLNKDKIDLTNSQAS